jgi:pyruvate ferredoxin oxidoreductase gamma subunit
MIQIRFHGRGGHGVKTASRIVGTAAFLAGFQAQDSPIYDSRRTGRLGPSGGHYQPCG